MIFSTNKVKELLMSGDIKITPLLDENFDEASYKLTLDLDGQEKILLQPGQFRILKTIEKVTLSPYVGCFITTRASIAKMGIDIAQSSIFCEPDTDNVITLEVSNQSNEPQELVHGMRIAKAIFVQII